MSVDTTFRPFTPTYAVDNTGAVQIKEAAQAGAVTFRIRALVASGYITWGPATIAAAAAPVIGTPQENTVGVTLGQAIYLDLPAASFFRGNAAFAAGGFEVTAGQGGVGG